MAAPTAKELWICHERSRHAQIKGGEQRVKGLPSDALGRSPARANVRGHNRAHRGVGVNHQYNGHAVARVASDDVLQC